MKTGFFCVAMFFLCLRTAHAQTSSTTALPSSASPSPSASPSAAPAETAGESKPVGTPVNPSGTAKVSKGAPVLPPEKAQPVKLPSFAKPPTIDGKLDDEVWKSAVVLKDFYQVQPGDNIAPSKPTEVMLGYDSRFLYVAFHCFDEPDKVRANIPKRDDIFND
ncbi:MAG: hypothetical protein M3R69_11290, partial [Acidobacteriota bacterium]|nr:hypothetical protein [Acidobacteriota bacterium]